VNPARQPSNSTINAWHTSRVLHAALPPEGAQRPQSRIWTTSETIYILLVSELHQLLNNRLEIKIILSWLKKCSVISYTDFWILAQLYLYYIVLKWQICQVSSCWHVWKLFKTSVLQQLAPRSLLPAVLLFTCIHCFICTKHNVCLRWESTPSFPTSFFRRNVNNFSYHGT